jgi:hypothetical protein
LFVWLRLLRTTPWIRLDVDWRSMLLNAVFKEKKQQQKYKPEAYLIACFMYILLRISASLDGTLRIVSWTGLKFRFLWKFRLLQGYVLFYLCAEIKQYLFHEISAYLERLQTCFMYIASCDGFSYYYRFSDIAINSVNPSFIWLLEFSKNG